jgi:hypothetical protein
VPSQVIPAYHQIVQTDASVLIFTEWMNDARVIYVRTASIRVARLAATLGRSRVCPACRIRFSKGTGWGSRFAEGAAAAPKVQRRH